MALRATRPLFAAFRRTAPARGGGGAHPPTPAHVWTPAGGWMWGNPEGWKGSLVKAFAVIFASWGVMGAISAGVEERPLAPKHKIPSSMWSRVKAVDDGYKSDPHV